MRLIMRSVFINPEEFSYGHLHDLYLSIMDFHLPPKPTAKPLKKKRVALSYKNSAAPLDITISPEIFNNPGSSTPQNNSNPASNRIHPIIHLMVLLIQILLHLTIHLLVVLLIQILHLIIHQILVHLVCGSILSKFF